MLNISVMVQGVAMFTVEDEWELLCDLSNGAISNPMTLSDP